MMDWDSAISRAVDTLDVMDRALVPAMGAAVYESVVLGSPITGAPGQVVADENGGNLRASYQLTFPEVDKALIATKSVYAEQNEDGIARPGGGPYIQRSAIGGRWSIALTRMNFQRLLDSVVNAGLRPTGFTDNSALSGQ